jgi:hypothetical protein
MCPCSSALIILPYFAEALSSALSNFTLSLPIIFLLFFFWFDLFLRDKSKELDDEWIVLGGYCFISCIEDLKGSFWVLPKLVIPDEIPEMEDPIDECLPIGFIG